MPNVTSTRAAERRDGSRRRRPGRRGRPCRGPPSERPSVRCTRSRRATRATSRRAARRDPSPAPSGTPRTSPRTTPTRSRACRTDPTGSAGTTPPAPSRGTRRPSPTPPSRTRTPPSSSGRSRSRTSTPPPPRPPTSTSSASPPDTPTPTPPPSAAGTSAPPPAPLSHSANPFASSHDTFTTGWSSPFRRLSLVRPAVVVRPEPPVLPVRHLRHPQVERLRQHHLVLGLVVESRPSSARSATPSGTSPTGSARTASRSRSRTRPGRRPPSRPPSGRRTPWPSRGRLPAGRLAGRGRRLPGAGAGGTGAAGSSPPAQRGERQDAGTGARCGTWEAPARAGQGRRRARSEARGLPALRSALTPTGKPDGRRVCRHRRSPGRPEVAPESPHGDRWTPFPASGRHYARAGGGGRGRPAEASLRPPEARTRVGGGTAGFEPG